MNKNLFERAKAYILAHHRRSVWYRIMGVLAVCVVFVTTYMLVLPAITMERPTYCGLTEHIHTKECYTEQYLFTCGKLESDEHTHTDDCISAISSLTCTEPEHKHNDYCYMEEIRQEMLTDEILIDNTPEQQALPEVAYEDDAAAEEELTETETETETEAPTILTWDNLDRTADKNFALRLRTKDGAFADGSVLDVEYMNESAAAPYAESLQAQLASEEADRDVELTAVLPVKISVRDASGNEVSVRGAELSIYLNSMADVTTDTALFAQYETVNAAKWTPVNYVRMLGSAEDGEHLDADVEEGGVFLLANVQYVERAAQTETATETETEAPAEAATEAQTEQTAETSTEAETETETIGPENAAGPSTQPQTEDAAGDGADLENGSESESETETEETTVRVLETKAPETDETGTDTTTETETETTETEPEYTCGLEEHTHDASCFAAPKNGVGIEELVCTKKIHKHDASCIGTKETESENEIKAETETASETETETESESASGSEKETETEIESESASGSEKETEMETEAESTSEPETTAESELTGETETESESESEMADLPFGDGGYDSEYGEGFEDNGVLTQGKEPEKESENNKAEYQPEYICGLEEHTHVDACYNEAGELVCGLEEHVHTDACVELPMAEGQDDVQRGPGTDLLADPKTKISGSGTEYNPETGEFKTDLKFDYELNKSDVKDVAKYEYYINIPDGIIVPDGLVTQGLKTFNDLDSGKPAGQYEFVKDENGKYSIKIHFDSAYVDGAGEILRGFVGFEGFLEIDSYQSDGSLKVEFGDNQELTIPADQIKFDQDETAHYDIDISKDGYYDLKNNKLVYKVIIKSLKGTPDPINFEDILNANGLTINGAPNVKVQKGTFNYFDQYYSSEVADLQNVDVSYTYDEATKKLSMQLDRLIGGETISENGREAIHAWAYVITYEYPLTALPTDVELSADNTATVGSQDTGTGEFVTDSSSKQVDISTEMTFTKGGWYNSAGKYIEWTLTINSNQLNIAGATLEDTMLPTSAEDITVDPDEGWELKDGKICFTAIGDTGINTNKYTIKYKTPVETIWDGKTVENRATFDWDGTPGNGDEKTASQTVTTNGGSVEKNLVSSGEIKADNTVELTWKTKIVVPDGGLPSDIVLTDSTLNPYSADGKKHYMTPAQIKDLVDSIAKGGTAETITWPADGKYDITFTDESGKKYSYEDTQNAENANVHIVKFEITIKSLTASAGEYWFTYKTTADLSGAQRGANTYYNNVEIGGKESNATYTFREGGVVKTDGNYQSQTTDVTNDGTLSWRVKASVDSRKPYKKLKIVDRLPEHILLSEIVFDNSKLPITAEGKFEGTVNGYKISGTYNKETGEVEATITRENPEDSLDPNKDFEILYTCSVDKKNLEELEDGQKYTFTNKVTVYKDDVEFGTDNQTQNWTEEVHVIGEKKVEKLGVWDNDNRQIDYEVVINPLGEDLVLNNDEMTLTDILTYVSGNNSYANFDRNVSLIQSTVKLYEAQKDASGELALDEKGKLKKGELITDWEWVYHEKSEPDSTWGEKFTNTITGKIPDGKALILVYSYRVQMNYPPKDWSGGNDGLTVQNQVMIEGTGYGDYSNNQDDKWEKQSSSAGVVTDKNYTFYKVEKGSYGVALKDAKFLIYEVDDAGKEREVKESTTDISGKFQIVWENGGPFKKNTLYYAVEEEAPNGYIKPENPPKYYFYFADGTANLPGNIPDGAVNLSATSHAAYIENEKNDTDIEVDKKWLDAAGNDVTAGTDGKVEFDLYQRENLTPPDGFTSEGSTGGSTSDTDGSGRVKIFAKQANGSHGETVEATVDYIVGARAKIVVITKGYGSGSSWNPTLTVYYDDSSTKICDICADNSSDSQPREGVEYGSDTCTFTFYVDITEQTEKIRIETNDSSVGYGVNSIWAEIVSTPQPDIDSGSEAGGDSSEDSSGEVVEDKLIGTYSIDKASNWIWRSKDVEGLTLPKVGTNGEGKTVYYTYYVKEKSAEFYKADYSANNTDGIVSGTITITNTKPDKEVMGLSVEKKWDDKGAPLTGEHESIQVELWKKGNSEAEDHGDVRVDTQELKKENGWSYSWTDLDSDVEYYVKEVGEITGYDVTYSVNGGEEKSVAREVTAKPGNDYPKLVIKNTLRITSVDVKKVWLSADDKEKNADAKLPEITVHLWKKGENEADNTEIQPAVKLGIAHKDELNYTDNGWGYTWPNLPEGEYYVVEDPIEGYETTYHSETKAADGAELTKSESKENGSEVTVKAGSLVITNTEEPIKIEVEKVWTDGNDKHSSDSVTMELYSSTTPPESEAETEPKEPDTDPNPGTGETDPENPDTDPEQTESDSEKQEPVVTKFVTVNVSVQWENGTAEEAGNGWAWIGLTKSSTSDGNGVDWNSWENQFKVNDGSNNLSQNNNWVYSLTLPGEITTGDAVETQYYRLWIDDTPKLDDTGKDNGNTIDALKILGESNPTYKVIDGSQGTVNVQLSAHIFEQEGSGGTEGSGGDEGAGETTLTVFANQYGNDKGLSSGTTTIRNGTAIVKVKYQQKYATYVKRGSFEKVNGISITDENDEFDPYDDGKVNGGFLIEVYRIEGLSGKCELIYDRGENQEWGLVSITIEDPYAPTPASFSLNTPKMFISAPNTSLNSVLSNTVPVCPEGAQYEGEVTLNASNGWHHTWENLPKTDEHGNLLYYYVKEKELGEGYITTYAYEYVDDNETKGIKKVTVTNTPPEKRTTSVDVQKIWQDENGETKEAWLDSIQVELLNAAGERVAREEGDNPITLNKENEWSHKWTDLPEGTYSVREINDGTSYTAKYSNGTTESSKPNEVAVTGGNITITNQSTDISVKKKWKDCAGNEMTKDALSEKSIKVELWKKDAGDAQGVHMENKDVTLGQDKTDGPDTLFGTYSDDGWGFTWKNLPLGEYYVKEQSDLKGYTVSYSNGTDTGTETDSETDTAGGETDGEADLSLYAVKSGTITITNQQESTSYRVKKEWAANSAQDDSVTVQLYQTTSKEAAEAERNTSKNELTQVMLAKAIDATRTSRAVSTRGTTITVSISNWQGGGENTQRQHAGYAWVQIWQYDENGNRLGNTPMNVGNEVLSYENDWTITVTGLPQYAMVDNEMHPLNYFVQFSAGGAGNSIVSVTLPDGTSNGCLVKGTSPSSVSLTATLGEGTGMGIATRKRLAMTNPLSLDGAGEETDYPKPYGEIITLSAPSWSKEWTDLPKYDENGNLLYYYVKEQGINDETNYDDKTKYKVESSYIEEGEGGIQTQTITNTKLIEVTVQKKWDYPESWKNTDKEQSIREYTIQVMLYRDGNPMKEAVLKWNEEQGVSWKSSWTGLEPGHEYTVKEVRVYTTVDGKEVNISEYEAQISEPADDGNGNLTFTITNKYNPNPYTLPETGGPGTLPYTVGGTLLMAFASLLLYIQNKRRKEGQHTS